MARVHLLHGGARGCVSETAVLQLNAAVHLDTGAVAASGGDLLWTGRTLCPQRSAPSGVPAVKEILNNSSGVPPGYPNSGVAPSSLLIVRGSSLFDPGDPVLQPSDASGLRRELNGASLTVTVK